MSIAGYLPKNRRAGMGLTIYGPRTRTTDLRTVGHGIGPNPRLTLTLTLTLTLILTLTLFTDHGPWSMVRGHRIEIPAKNTAVIIPVTRRQSQFVQIEGTIVVYGTSPFQYNSTV